MAEKNVFSRGVRAVREGVKHLGTYGSGKILGKNSFTFFGVPSGLTTGLDPNEGVKQILYPESMLFLKAPKTVDTPLFERFRLMLQGMPTPEYGNLAFKEGTATSLGGNLSCKGKLVTTFLQPIDGKKPNEHDLFRFSTKRFFPKIYHANEPLATLASGWQGAFYHWMFDVLPRLHLVENSGILPSLFYVESYFSFQKESLKLLGIDSHQIVNAKHYHAATSPELIVPSIAEIPTEWSCNFLREKFLPKLKKRNPIRLYVSRNDATRRRIINESELLQILSQYGFVKVELSNLPFQEQAELFAAAEAVIGPHGAGFSHLVFCHPKTPVLEFFSPCYTHPCYWHLADRIALDYYYLFGEAKPEGDDPDIALDLDKVIASLKLMGLDTWGFVD